MEPAPILQEPALEVELLHPTMRDSGHPAELRGLTEVSDHEVGVSTPHAIVDSMGTEGIRDHPPVDDQLVLQSCGPIEFESGVKETGVPQRRQGHQDARPTPVRELASNADVVSPRIIVEEVNGEPINHWRAYGAEHLEENLQFGL